MLAQPPSGQRLDLVAGEHGVERRNGETTLATGRTGSPSSAETMKRNWRRSSRRRSRKGATVRNVTVGRIDLALLAVLRNAVALEVAQVHVGRLGADELPAARIAALRVELHDARLDCDPTRAGARPAAPAPGGCGSSASLPPRHGRAH